jgi:hypothetical protein
VRPGARVELKIAHRQPQADAKILVRDIEDRVEPCVDILTASRSEAQRVTIAEQSPAQAVGNRTVIAIPAVVVDGIAATLIADIPQDQIAKDRRIKVRLQAEMGLVHCDSSTIGSSTIWHSTSSL